MLSSKAHKAALMHLAKQMRDMEFSGGEGSPEEEASESPAEEAAEDGASPMSKMAHEAEASMLGKGQDEQGEEDPEMARRHAFMKGIKPIKRSVSMTVVAAPMGKGKMKRG